MKQLEQFKTKKSMLIAIAVCSVLWLMSFVYAISSYNAVTKSIKSARANIECMESLASEIDTVDKYNGAIRKIRGFIDEHSRGDDIASVLKKNIPNIPSAEVVDTRIDVLPNSALTKKTTTLTWNEISPDGLSDIIRTAENADVPYRMTSLSVTPSKFETMQITAIFTTFTK